MRLSREQWEKIDSCNIINYAQENGMEVERVGNKWRLKEHDSCIFFQPTNFYRYSTQKSGGLYQFITEFIESDHIKALQMAMEYAQITVKEVIPTTIHKDNKPIAYTVPKDLVLPKADRNCSAIFGYLCKQRKIPYDIVKSYVKNRRLYQDEYKNCIFVGRHEDDVYYVGRHSTKPNGFKGDVKNSAKFSGLFVEGKNATDVVVTEAVIDQMSFMALTKIPESHNYLSINGVGSVISCLDFNIKNHKTQFKKVYFALDNDRAGIEATEKGKKFIEQNYPEIQVAILKPYNKDWNEDLVADVQNKNKTDGPVQKTESELKNHDVR